MGITDWGVKKMEQTQRIQKLSLIYLLAYILIPCAMLAAAFAVSLRLIEDSTVAALVMTCFLMLAVFWWLYLGGLFYDKGEKKRMAALDDQGFVRNHTFHSNGCTVAVDLVHGRLALMFRWNPGRTFIVPANRISKVWVDDGCGGPGFLRGACRVSFLFTVEGVTVRVNTFISNRRWSPESDNVLVGISKADVMADVLNQARERVA